MSGTRDGREWVSARGSLVVRVSKTTRHYRTILPIVFAVTYIGIMVNSLIAPVIPTIATDLGLSDLQAASIPAAATLPGIVVAPLVGMLADLRGRRVVIAACLAVFGVAGGMVVFSQNYPELLAARVVQGLGAVGLINLSVVMISDHFEGAARAKWIGINAVVLTAGLALNPLIGGFLAGAGWRSVFIPYWLALVVAVFVLRLPPDRPRRPTPAGVYLRGVFCQARQPQVMVLCLSGLVAFILVFGVTLAAFPFLLDREFDYSPPRIAIFLTVAGVLAGIGSLLSGRLSIRLDLSSLVAVGIGMLGLGYVALAGAPGWWVLVLGSAVYGAGEGLAIPVMQNLASSVGDPRYRGATVALWAGFVRLGQTLGPLIFGVAMQLIGIRGAIFAGAILAFLWAVVERIVHPRVTATLGESR